MCSESGKLFNRAFFITPDSEYYYDKKHLFRMGEESKFYTPGEKQEIIEYKGWKIMLQVCYDLRFPIWCRNIENNYDLILFTANWPKARENAWTTLLQARAIENCCYVAAANRVGTDGNNLIYNGASSLINMKGDSDFAFLSETIINKTISLENLVSFRKKFPVWLDADKFTIIN